MIPSYANAGMLAGATGSIGLTQLLTGASEAMNYPRRALWNYLSGGRITDGSDLAQALGMDPEGWPGFLTGNAAEMVFDPLNVIGILGGGAGRAIGKGLDIGLAAKKAPLAEALAGVSSSRAAAMDAEKAAKAAELAGHTADLSTMRNMQKAAFNEMRQMPEYDRLADTAIMNQLPQGPGLPGVRNVSSAPPSHTAFMSRMGGGELGTNELGKLTMDFPGGVPPWVDRRGGLTWAAIPDEAKSLLQPERMPTLGEALGLKGAHPGDLPDFGNIFADAGDLGRGAGGARGVTMPVTNLPVNEAHRYATDKIAQIQQDIARLPTTQSPGLMNTLAELSSNERMLQDQLAGTAYRYSPEQAMLMSQLGSGGLGASVLAGGLFGQRHPAIEPPPPPPEWEQLNVMPRDLTEMAPMPQELFPDYDEQRRRRLREMQIQRKL